MANGLLAAALGNTYEFVIHRNEKGQYYWIMHNTVGNKEPFAISEMYVDKKGAEYSIDLVKRHAATAPIR